MTGSEESPDPVAALRRWEDSGGGWRLAATAGGWMRIELTTCTGDEVVGAIESDDAHLFDHVGDRTAHPA